MLELRPNCECCDTDLPPEAPNAMICTFECTFCTHCAATRFQNTCPNCTGNFTPRPIRPPTHLTKYPASTTRTTKPHPQCNSPSAAT